MSTPVKLQEIQLWFSSVITSKISEENRLLPEVEGRNFRREAACYILPTKQPEPFERIGIYHQQYWWRLIDTLQQNFPALTRFLGYEKFNQEVAIPYLCQNPVKNYALRCLGDTLANFLKKKPLLSQLAQVDFAMNKALWVESAPPITLPVHNLFLQPHVFLLKSSFNIFSFREKLLKEDALPEQGRGTFYFLLFRTSNNTLSWKTLCPDTYRILKKIEKGISLKSLCRKEKQGLLPLWLFTWTRWGILAA